MSRTKNLLDLSLSSLAESKQTNKFKIKTKKENLCVCIIYDI